MCGPGRHGLTKLGISSEKIYAISAWEQSQHFSDEERVVLKATEEVTRLTDGAGGLSDATFIDLAAHFDEPQIAAFVLNISLVHFWDRVTTPPIRYLVPGDETSTGFYLDAAIEREHQCLALPWAQRCVDRDGGRLGGDKGACD